MRDIRIAHLDKARPVLVLTRESMAEAMTKVTVAPITSSIRGLSTEVRVGSRNGLDHDSVVTCDNIMTIERDWLGRHIGLLMDDQEHALATAIMLAFDLELR